MRVDTVRKVIIGIGNVHRGDDGIGRHIARKLIQVKCADLTVFEESGEAAGLMESWKGADLVVIIDAMVSGDTPGNVRGFDASKDPLPKEYFPQISTHTFSVAETIELARAMKLLPPKVLVYGIEGRQFDHGKGLSAEVEKATPKVINRVLKDIEQG
jgi:hydrogenase maturation protease